MLLIHVDKQDCVYVDRYLQTVYIINHSVY